MLEVQIKPRVQCLRNINICLCVCVIFIVDVYRLLTVPHLKTPSSSRIFNSNTIKSHKTCANYNHPAVMESFWNVLIFVFVKKSDRDPIMFVKTFLLDRTQQTQSEPCVIHQWNILAFCSLTVITSCVQSDVCIDVV